MSPEFRFCPPHQTCIFLGLYWFVGGVVVEVDLERFVRTAVLGPVDLDVLQHDVGTKVHPPRLPHDTASPTVVTC